MSDTALPRRNLHTALIDAVVVVLMVLAIWEALFAYAGDVAITPPLATFRYAIDLLGSAQFWPNVAATMLAFVYALLISAFAGIALGLWLGLRRFAGDVAEPMLVALYTIPKVTVYPVMLLVFGLGLSAKVAFGVIHGMIPVVLFTLGAVKNLPPVYLRAAKTFRLTAFETGWSVLLPAVLPEVVSGLRIGFSVTLLGVLIGEMFASQRGLGYLIINGIDSHNVPMITAVTLMVMLFAVGANALLLLLNRWMQARSLDG
jgi:NitT/TauT family transport system permease protein